MGTKFGNIHVKTIDLSVVTDALQKISTDNSSRLHQAASSFYIAQIQPGWVSILNDSFGWGEVESFGETLSSHVPFPVMTISYFDDDLLEMKILAKGEELTGQVWCSDETREEYELEDELADVGILSELLGHHHISKITEIIELEDCEEAIEELQNVMQIPLWIHSEWFNEIEDEEFTEKYIKHDFN